VSDTTVHKKRETLPVKSTHYKKRETLPVKSTH